MKSNIYAEMGKRLNFRSARSDRDRKNMEVAAKRWIKKKHPTFDGDVYVENIRCFLDISQEELEKRKCTVNEQDTTALIFSQKHLEALYLQWGSIGNNYVKALLALGFQGFFMMVCVAIYAVLVNAITVADNLHTAIWSVAAYTVILCFSLFKTSSLAKSIFNAH